MLSRRRALQGALATGALLGTSGCALLGGARGGGSNGRGEQATIRVGTLPTTEYAPLALAVRRGYFRQEGLRVEVVRATDGSAALTSLISGDYDLALSSYVPLLTAQARGAAELRIVADCGASTPGTAMLMTYPSSPVRAPADLAGRRIGISALGTISELLVKSALRTYGVDERSAQLAPISFPNMPAALAQQRLDGAVLTEPFVTLATRDGSARPVADVATGPTERLPLTGYGATDRFVRENPKTVAAFQRGLNRAAQDCRDRRVVEPLLPEIAQLAPDVAAQVGLIEYRSVPDPAQLQRVSRLMREFGFIDTELDVAPMLAPQS